MIRSLKWMLLVVVSWMSVGVNAQESVQSPQVDLRGLQTLNRIGQRLKQLGDWGQQHALIDQAIASVWDQHGWQSEADEFARDTTREVAKIPPWEIDARLEKFVGRYAERYGLGSEVSEELKQRMYGHALGLMWKHAGVLMEQTDEMVDMRVHDKPFTPELVAKWTRQTEPLFEDATGRIESLMEEVSKHVDAQHRALWEQDRQSYRKRMIDMGQDRERWVRGEWNPKAWGLQDDPVHRRAAQAAARRGDDRGAASQTANMQQALAYDPATWKWYLRKLAVRYDLDPGQRTAAESILVEMVERVTLYIKARRAQLEPIPRDQRLTDPAFLPIRGMFRELRDRLERIPTVGQRRQAKAQTAVE